MMEHTLQMIFLAIVQGITEFLPISSSAHLVLIPQWLSWPNQGLVFDVAVHLGSLIALMFYFRAEITLFLKSLFYKFSWSSLLQDESYLWAFKVAVGTVPVFIVGGLFAAAIDVWFRNPLIIAYTMIGFGVLLYFSQWYAQKYTASFKPVDAFEPSMILQPMHISFAQAFAIGCAQVFALIPGTSRSGVTLTAGLMLGLPVSDAVRFSLLLGMPTILGAGVLLTVKEYDKLSFLPLGELLLCTFISAVTAYICLYYFVKYIQRTGVLPYVIYRIVLGVLLLI